MVLDTSNMSAEAIDAVNSKDWDKLVKLVLAGEGDQLAEKKSQDEEVQEFLDNVPAFQVRAI